MPSETEQHAKNLKKARGEKQKTSGNPTPKAESNKDTANQTNLWPLVFATSITCDCIDLIPFIGQLLTAPFRALILIFVSKQKAKQSRSFIYILLALAFIAPTGTLAIFLLWQQSKK
jgi:hypothetical protein